MPIAFLNPLLLFGLAALSIPVLVHLVHSRRARRTPFPSLMFLEATTFRAHRRRRVRDLPLLLLRLAAFLLIVLAFARPYLRGALEAAGAGGARHRVVLLDRSWSMRYGDRWTEALRAARAEFEGLPVGARGSLVLFDEGAEVVAGPTADRVLLLDGLARSEPGWSGTRLRPALEAADRLFAEGEGGGEVVLVSDLQALAWLPGEAGVLPASTPLRIIDLSRPGSEDAGIASVRARRAGGEEAAGEEVALDALLFNHGPHPLRGVEVTLQAGETTRSVRVDVPAGGTVPASFEGLPLPAAGLAATLRIREDELAADDVFYATIPPEPRREALILQAAGSPSRQSLYLIRALEVLEAPRLQVRSLPGIDLPELDPVRTPLVVLNDPGMLPAAVRSELDAYVRAGGGLLVLLGPAWRAGTDPAGEELLPGGVGPPVDRIREAGVTLSGLDYDHPVFAVFRRPGSGAFTGARFFRYRPVPSEWADRVPARFSDGAPALIERDLGAGHVLLWTSLFDNVWNDLVLQPVFLPLVGQTVLHLTRYRPLPLWYDVGAPLASGEAGPLPPGFHERAGREGENPVEIAVNVDRREADLTPLDAGELALRAVRPAGEAPREAGLGSRPGEVLSGRSWAWWYLLVAAVLALAAEAHLAGRRDARPKTRGVVA